MEDELTRRLTEAYQGLARLRKIESMLNKLHIQKREIAAAVAQYHEALAKEDADVQKLEKSGISALFYSFLGTLDKRLDKERAEALAARLKLEQAEKQAAEVNKRIEELSSERKKLSCCADEYASLYQQKKQSLLAAHGSAAQRILELSDGINLSNVNIKEIGEAIAAGERALYHLDAARESLGSAKNWSVYDMLGGGLIASAIKHDRIDGAADEVVWAQTALNDFRTELADVHVDANIEVGISGFARFADFFFDGLIADWYAQGRIEDSLQSVCNARNEVAVQMARLKSLESEEQRLIQSNKAELDSLILNTSD